MNSSSTHQTSPNSRNNKTLHRKSSHEILAAKFSDLVLWKRPFSTLYHFTLGIIDNLYTAIDTLIQNKVKCAIFMVGIAVFYAMDSTTGPHQVIFTDIKKQGYWILYWVFLGFLSSFGLGTGLHTFVLYLGPHIARVSLAAWTCKSLDFPAPPYPDEVLCPSYDKYQTSEITFWKIFWKIYVEAISWGAGTAIGELPPFFMARAATLSGEQVLSDEEINESPLKKRVRDLITKFGFFGILLFASVPNPLFDLAGIFCGYFLVSFWTFFTATLIGKAGFKMFFQTSFVIILFSEDYLERIIELISSIPKIGLLVKPHIHGFFQQQKDKIKDRYTNPNGSLISTFLTYFVTGMIIYFFISFVNSVAQNHAISKAKEEVKNTQEMKKSQ